MAKRHKNGRGKAKEKADEKPSVEVEGGKNHANESEEEKHMERKIEMDILKILGFVAVLLAIFAASFFGVKYIIEGPSSFEHSGITFTKELIGDVVFYTASYDAVTDRGQPYAYNMFLRIDPRENTVPVEGKIQFNRGNTIYIGLANSAIEGCDDSIISVGGLAHFLGGNQLHAFAGGLYEEEAQIRGLEHYSCDVIENAVVIEIFRGDETKIISNGDNCIKIQVSECKILDATEKFQVQALVDAINRSS
jgi:hypothetical protein